VEGRSQRLIVFKADKAIHRCHHNGLVHLQYSPICSPERKTGAGQNARILYQIKFMLIDYAQERLTIFGQFSLTDTIN
jgi:hypothetical protein